MVIFLYYSLCNGRVLFKLNPLDRSIRRIDLYEILSCLCSLFSILSGLQGLASLQLLVKRKAAVGLFPIEYCCAYQGSYSVQFHSIHV